jgi:hypothetical protein
MGDTPNQLNVDWRVGKTVGDFPTIEDIKDKRFCVAVLCNKGAAAVLDARLLSAAPEMFNELFALCAEVSGDGTKRCKRYKACGGKCIHAKAGGCGIFLALCKASGVDVDVI